MVCDLMYNVIMLLCSHLIVTMHSYLCTCCDEMPLNLISLRILL